MGEQGINEELAVAQMRKRLDELGVPPNATRIMFTHRSKDVPPGEGAAEEGAGSDMDLPRLGTNWRQALSNFACCPIRMPFGLDGQELEFSSVEAAFQAGKYFVNGLHDGVKEVLKCKTGLEARKCRKYIRLDDEQLEKWEREKHAVMEQALREKFATPEYQPILLATGTAHLTHQPPRARGYGWHVINGKEVFVDNSQYTLMQIRRDWSADDEGKQTSHT